MGQIQREIDPPEPSTAGSDLEQTLRSMQGLFQKQMERELEQAPSLQTWLSSRLPSANALCGNSISETVLLSESLGVWLGFEEREQQCARCRIEDVQCLSSQAHVGKKIALRVVGEQAVFTKTDCERYREWRLAKRLESIGLGPRFARVKLSDLGASPPASVLIAFGDFVDDGSDQTGSRRAPASMQLLITGNQSREYGATLIRSTVVAFPSCNMAWVHVPTLFREAKDAMTRKEGNPLQDLVQVPVLALDEVDTVVLHNEWFRGELRWVYGRRRDQGMPTVVTAPSLAAKQIEELFQGIRVVRV